MTMQVFRNSAKPLIYIVTASFFVWLVLDLSGLSGGTGLLSQTSAGKVDGQTIEARYYTTMVQQAIEERQRSSQTPMTLDDIVQVRNEVWQQIVQSTVLQREYKRRGLVATPGGNRRRHQELPAAAAPVGASSSRPTTSSTSASTSAGSPPASGSSTSRSSRRSTARRSCRASCSAWSRRTSTCPIPPSGSPTATRTRPRRWRWRPSCPAAPSPTRRWRVTDEEIQAYYKAHPDQFTRPATAYMSFVALPRFTNASDTAAAYDHALAVRKEIVDGAPFAEIAARESSDSVSASKGGDLGEFDQGLDGRRVRRRWPSRSRSTPSPSRCSRSSATT